MLAADGEQSLSEGCLSLPGWRGVVKRRTRLVLATRTPDGEEAVTELVGELARIGSQETDHLAGRLFIDRIASPLLANLVHEE